MSTATRARRTTGPAPLSNLERLLLAQAVYELGASAASWPGVAKILSKHPSISRPKTYFTPATCSGMYIALMQEARIERTDGNVGVHGAANLKLAQIFYQARVKELRQLIEEEETKFKNIAVELEQIRNGEWDDRIKRDTLGIQPEAGPSNAPQAIILPTILPHGLIDRGMSPKRIEQHAMNMSLSNHDPISIPSPRIRSPSPSSRRASPRRRGSPFKRETASPTREDAEEGQSGDESLAAQIIKRRGGTYTATPEGSRAASSAVEGEVPRGSSSKPRPLPKRTRGRANTISRLSSEETTPAKEASAEVGGSGDEATSVGRPSSPEVSQRRASKRRASIVEPADITRDKKKPKVEADDEVPTSAATKKSRKAAANNAKKFHTIIAGLHDVISEHRNGNVFHNPIKKSEAPDYLDIVKRPMDLKTIKLRAKEGVITTSQEYKRDIYLMFCNALMYNRPGSDIYVMAEQMMLDSEEKITAFQSNEIFVPTI